MYQVMKSKIISNKKLNDGVAKINFKKFFNLKSIFVYISSILITTCKLSSGATPFGLAFIGAIADSGFPLIIPLILAAIVTGVSFGWIPLAKFIISAVIFVLMKSFIKSNNKTSNAVKILFSTAISEVIILMFNGALIYDAVMAAFVSATTAIFYLVFSSGLEVLMNLQDRRIDSHETLMACGILVTVAMTAFSNLTIFNLSILSIVSVLIVMVLGWLRGMAVGITTGISISIVLGLMGIGDATLVATYAVCGLLSGFLARYGKFGAVIGFILGNAIWVFCINASTNTIIPIGEIAIASLILFFLPNKVSVLVDELFESWDALKGNDPIGFLAESTIFKLKAVSDVANDMAGNLENAANDDNNPVSEFIKTLTGNSCSKCPNYKKCWNENYHLMYETVFNALEVLNAKSTINVGDIENAICTDKSQLTSGLNFSYEIYKVNNDWKNRVKENRRLVATQLRGVSKVADVVKESVEHTNSEPLLGAGYKLEVGIAKTKKKGSNISGDNTVFTRLKNGKVLVGISDGMGTGEVANAVSKKTLELIEKYLNTGLEKKVAIDLINSYMMLGENKDNFASLDVSLFNENDASIEFIKQGACTSYIKKESKVSMIESHALPIGTEGLQYNDNEIVKLSRGDLVVWVSDGIVDSNKKDSNWIKNVVYSIKSNSKPQRIADIILQESIDNNFGVSNDDMTVIVAKVN